MIDLNKIKARTTAATPGPWEKIESHLGKKEPYYGVYTWDKKSITGWGRVCQPGNDAAFIAHARVDIPALVAEVDRLQEALTEAKNEIKFLRTLLSTIHSKR